MGASSTVPPPPMRQRRPQPTGKGLPFGSIGKPAGYKVVIYGTGGVGKTTLAVNAPGKIAYYDFDNALAKLFRSDAPGNVLPIVAETWQEIRDHLAMPGWDDISTIVIDSATRLEEMAIAHTLATVPTEKRGRADNIESYGYGKGYQHVFDTFSPILADLERHSLQGRNIVLVAHECAERVPNPAGEDYLQYQPRLQSPTSGKASIRLRVKEWCDVMAFVGYDVSVDGDRKAKGSGTRTLYPIQLPHCMAKSRTVQEPIYLDPNNLPTVWAQLIGE